MLVVLSGALIWVDWLLAHVLWAVAIIIALGWASSPQTADAAVPMPTTNAKRTISTPRDAAETEEVTKMRNLLIMIGGVALAVVSAGCQTATGPSPPDTAPASAAADGPVGRFDVGGHQLSLTCRGVGSPTIVFENGLGDTRGTWSSVNTTESFRSARTCVYDRVNLGGSDLVSGRHTGADSVRDLHALLDVAGVPGHYLLVGHSFGGLLAVMYAGTYPADVVGLVLVDPTLPATDEIVKLFPESERPTFMRQAAKNPERVDYFETLEQAKVLVPKVPNVPVLLLSATRVEVPPGWSVAQAEEISAASRKLEQRIVDVLSQGELRRVDSLHAIHWYEPQLVIDEVQRVLDKTR